MTSLDGVSDAMMNAQDGDDAARLRFYEFFSDTDFLILLETEAAGDVITPKVFAVEGGDIVLIFDSEERLAAFAPVAMPYAALPGRVIAGLLSKRGLGVGINLGVAPSSMILPAEAMDWLAETLAPAPQQAQMEYTDFLPPTGLPLRLIEGLELKLNRMPGVAAYVLLVGVRYKDGNEGHFMAFVDAKPDMEGALAQASAEALRFCGVEEGQMDVGFLRSTDEMTRRMAQCAWRFDLPQPQMPAEPVAPKRREGPPILRRKNVHN